mmetsp:Transcript_67691/g.195654  ORF Transcript_67691/g.195654 Transcript_67691/m.195654 type:complete len:530 (-) Transcript_67691:180-1769(-)
MIIYSSSRPSEYLRWNGSVAPKSLKWALPCAAIAGLYSYAIHSFPGLSNMTGNQTEAESTGWTLFTSILGFLLVFRAQLSYQRYWEGLTLVERACGVWLNGCSNLIAFCTDNPDKQDQVEEFQYILSRYVSLLLSYSMADVSKISIARFPHLSLEGIDPASIEYLESTSAKQHIVLQWVQRLVVEKSRDGVLDVAPPVLSRVFQEFSLGIVHFIDARKISNAPFPFAFAQMVWLMLVFFSVLPVPLICAVGMETAKACIYTFLVVFVFWSVHYIATEIELPFGEDPNDLPLDAISHRFNKVLERLLEVKAQESLSLVGRPTVSARYVKRESTSLSAIDEPSSPMTFRSSIMGAFVPGKSANSASDMFQKLSSGARRRAGASPQKPFMTDDAGGSSQIGNGREDADESASSRRESETIARAIDQSPWPERPDEAAPPLASERRGGEDWRAAWGSEMRAPVAMETRPRRGASGPAPLGGRPRGAPSPRRAPSLPRAPSPQRAPSPTRASSPPGGAASPVEVAYATEPMQIV